MHIEFILLQLKHLFKDIFFTVSGEADTLESELPSFKTTIFICYILLK